MRVYLESLFLHPPAVILLIFAAYFLPRTLVTALAGCFCTASGFRPDRAASPTLFRPSFCSAPPLAAGFPGTRFLVGDGGAIAFAGPLAGDGEMV